MNLLAEFLDEHRATLSEECEPIIANFKDEFETIDTELRDELIEDFQHECKLAIAEYISFHLGFDFLQIEEYLEDVNMLTYLDLSV